MPRAVPGRRLRRPWGALRGALWGALVFAAAGLAWPRQAAAQEYADAMAQARALEGEGEYETAAVVLRLILPLYPQDNALLLRIAADELVAGRYRDAEQTYRQALRRREWPEEAYLGLGLALEGQGACSSASVYLRNALVLSPGEPAAVAALGRCEGQDDWQVVPQGFLTGQYYRDDLLKDVVVGGGLGLTAGYRRRWQLRLLYRVLASPGKAPPGITANQGWVQHEAFIAAGYGQQRYGVEASYAFVHSGNDAVGDSNHLGLSVRYSPFGDLLLRTSVSLYDAAGLSAVLRAELSWRIPLGGVVSLQPGVAAYWTNLPLATAYPCTDTLNQGQNTTCADTGAGLIPGHVMASLTLSASGRRGALFLGGKFGDEYRSAYMDLPVFYDVLYHVAAGAWVGGQVPLDRRWSLSALLAWDRYFIQGAATQPNGEIDVVPSLPDGYYLTVGAARRF